jgi:hypothetical protein
VAALGFRGLREVFFFGGMAASSVRVRCERNFWCCLPESVVVWIRKYPLREGCIWMERYHVRLGKRRTTVTMDTIVSEYLALHLRVEPSTEAHSAVRGWLQGRLDESNDPGRFRVSQWLLGQAVEAVARPSLVEAHGRWLDKKISKKRRTRRA